MINDVERLPTSRLSEFLFKLAERVLILAVILYAARESEALGPKLSLLSVYIVLLIANSFWLSGYAQAFWQRYGIGDHERKIDDHPNAALRFLTKALMVGWPGFVTFLANNGLVYIVDHLAPFT